MAISPAAQKISDAAVLYFADKGFDTGSLNAVAESVGIKKATIYSHFKNKDELFIHAFNEAIASESAFVNECFDSDTICGERYLAHVSERYQQSSYLRLLIRTAFIPPEGLQQQVAEGYESFLAKIKSRFNDGLNHLSTRYEIELADAYLGIIDSVHVELLYATPEAADRRRKALWQLLVGAMQQ